MTKARLRDVTRWFVRILIGLATLATLFFVRTLQPATTGAAIFICVWLLLPYIALLAVLERGHRGPAPVADVVTACLVVGGGIAFLTFVIFIDPDPQGGIAVLFTPVYEGVAMMMLFPLLRRVFGT